MKRKICCRCKEIKSIKQFRKFLSGRNKDYYSSYCKNCVKEYKNSYEANHPEQNVYKSIITRCHDKNRRYYKKGIKNFLTSSLIKVLWERDKARLLKHPSIDRIDNNGDYTFENCRFIEREENSRRGGILGNPKGHKKTRRP